MNAKAKSSQPRSIKTAQSSDIEDRIRRRAFELYEQHGRVDGFALNDWLHAETETRRAQKQPKAKAARGAQC